MMKYSKWIGLLAVLLTIVAAYMPWIEVPSKNIVVYGMHSQGTNFGKPALMNLIMCGFCTVFFFWSAVLAKRFNLFFTAFNLAWTIRNYIILSTCRGGECPQKLFGLYLIGIAAILMVAASFFPDVVIDSGSQPDSPENEDNKKENK